ncbi:MAG: sigma 54-interacting transcriptional regulator, partial [Cyclobacteriaceae bacterium]
MIPGYAISEEIFRGRKRIVYRGVREEDNQEVIIKTLSTEYPSDTDIANLKNEYGIIKNLNHEGIIEAFGFVSDRNRPALVLEDIGGRSLKTFIDDVEIDFSTSLDIAIKLVKAVKELHQKQIIHKDINPKNIIVNSETGQVKLIDFSISSRLPKEDQKLSHPVSLEGTLAYMSPEQTGRMNRSIDYRTDFYSLGVTFYEMLTNHLPFKVQDPMESVHYHIAKIPIPPADLNQDIPVAISNIVMKLLAKTAEERYRSALGIQRDLEVCRNQWEASEHIEDFTPGLQDIKDRFQIPQKLYGRESEIDLLLAGFDRISHGSKEMFLVSGYSGIGKSALIHEVQKSIVERCGYFITGKFDQLQRTVPYIAIVGALRELMRQLLTESEEQLGVWKEKLLSALGVNGQVVVEVIPEVELIIGPQPAVAKLDPRQSDNRFKLVFQNFIRAFCQRTHPLVMFLDDLQWADPASLQLINLIVADQDTGFLYLLGAYRDNEVNPAHPLMATLSLIKGENGAAVKEIVLDPLDLHHINRLIIETIVNEDVSTMDLADLVLNKTDGNPFFVRQFITTLYQEDLIFFDSNSTSWQWEIEKIELANITNNVVDLMVQKLKKLPKSLQDVLQLAACIGNRFDLNSLSIIYEDSATKTVKNLWPAIQEGFVLPNSEFEAQVSNSDLDRAVHKPERIVFKFLHDRVQQAAYALIDESQKIKVHAKIGKLLLKNLAGAEQEERIFELVDHLNAGRELLITDKERLELAKLNLRAGVKAKDATAYEAARDYLVIGIDNLPDDMWGVTQEISFELHKSLAETEYLLGHFEKSEEIIAQILHHTQSTIERAQVYNILVVQQTLNSEYTKAIRTGRKALGELDIHLPTSKLQSSLRRELDVAKKLLGGRTIESLLQEPESALPEVKIAMKLLASVTVMCYMANPDLCRVATLEMVKMTLKNGRTPDSVFGYAFYGLVFSSVLKDYESAYKFGQLAIKLSEQLNNSAQKCKATHVFAAFINHWSRHLRLMLKINDEGFQAGLESGELQFAGYHRYNRALCLFYLGKNLDALLPELEELLQFGQKTRNQHATDPIMAVQLVALNLTGQTDGRLGFQNDDFEDKAFEKDLLERKGLPAFTHYNVVKAFVLYLYHEYQEANSCIEVTKDKLSFVSGHFSTAAHNFYQSLILAAMCLQQPEMQQDTLKQLKKNQKQMQVWAESCPENFLHKLLLVKAEIARIKDEIWEASELYDRAIEAAAKSDFIHEEALASELAARFYLTNSREKMAKVYLVEARNLYRKWGAIAKVKHLEEQFPQYLVETSFETMSTISATLTHEASTGGGARTLDFKTVIKAAQTISSEIVLKTLLEKLIRIAIENAGAQKGYLILEKDHKLYIEAAGSIDKQEVTVLNSIPLGTKGDSSKLPLSIVNYVQRTRESLLIPDAGNSSQYLNDSYIQQHRPKSILCTPVLDRGRLIGILYLENNLISDAFKPERIEVLQILSSQSAISLQNARLYEDLREALTEVEQLKDQLQAENIYLQEEIKLQHNFEEIITQNKEYQEMLASIEQVAPTNATVLILGESGTGKELLARAVHNSSKVAGKALVKVNCAALPENLIESELFGHEKGAFTGALAQKQGRFELADGGTIFLDEIGELPLALQSKLLRVLQEREFERLGNPKTMKVNVRVIAATNNDLEKAISKGTFREDLYYRLNVFPITSSPLRERRDDIPLLAHHFCQKYNGLFGKDISAIPETVMRELQLYDWPGNVRELENIIERAVIISRGKKLQLGNLDLKSKSAT